jgi:hypothetical protein
MDINDIYEKQVGENKLSISDLKRIFNKIDGDIFKSSICVEWHGSLSTLKKGFRKVYVRFPVMFYDNKKRCIKRILYKHFVKPIDRTSYISMRCKNPLCVALDHMVEKKYKTKTKAPEDKPDDPEKFKVYFD